MNSFNYASFEASKKLVDNGIFLKTDFFYVNTFSDMGWIFRTEGEFNDEDDFVPAPSMAEVWRELAKYNASLYWSKNNSVTFAVLEGSPSFYSINPADALIDLLIWVTEKNRERIVKKLTDRADKLKW